MKTLDEIEKSLFETVANVSEPPKGAYNFRLNGKSIGRQSSKNIDVQPQENGLIIKIAPKTNDEVVHIPVVISMSGHKETVVNDFYIGEDADVTIVAGCGIYNCGADDSIHNGVHSFHIGKNAKVRYIEKHYGAGPGAGKILNPVSEFYLEEGAYAEAELEQIRGVDSTDRVTKAELKDNAKILIREKMLTQGRQHAKSHIETLLIGKDTTADIVSRSVATDESRQEFTLHIEGDNLCRGHSECDAILQDNGSVIATPSLDAKHVDAQLIHEAAIGKIAGEQLNKLMTLGLTQNQAESQIINGFLK
ncbi:SufD family Fe-S cluster assembly protein [Candidatus Saccharibacteria bacterium]|nr:SufD family Fe-S cluster assembly protein [Candidatus Saccharibacteria bacterium]